MSNNLTKLFNRTPISSEITNQNLFNSKLSLHCAHQSLEPMRFALCFFNHHVSQMDALWLERKRRSAHAQTASTFWTVYDKSREQTLKVQTTQRQGLLCLSSSLGRFEKSPDTHRHCTGTQSCMLRILTVTLKHHPWIQPRILTHTRFTRKSAA